MNMSSILEFGLTAVDRFPALLIDATFKVTVLLALAGLLVLCLQRAGAAIRHLVWSLALAGALAMPILSGLLPDWQLVSLPRVATVFPAIGARHTPTRLRAPARSTPQSAIKDPITLSSPRPLAKTLDTPAPLQARPIALAARVPWSFRLAVAWAIGAAVVLSLLVAGLLRMRRLGRASSPVTDAALLLAARELAHRLDLHREVELRCTSGPTMPMTWGWMRPVVLLPHDAPTWPEARRHAVLLHELAHVKRQDYLLQLVAQVACGIYWFHPLVWLAARGLRSERERACDDQVLRIGSKPSEYARQLLEMARVLRPVGLRLVPTVAMAAPSQLATRLGAILDADRRRPVLGRRLAWLACLASLVISVPLSAVGPKVPRRAETESVTTAPGRAPRTTTQSRATRQRTVTSAPVTTRTTVTTKTVPGTASTPALATRSLSTSTSTTEATPTTEPAPEAMPVLAAGPSTRSASASRSSSSSASSTTTKSNTHSSTHIEDDGSMALVADEDGRRVKLEVQGKVKFNADDTAVESLSNGGTFELEERIGHDRRRLEISEDKDALHYEYTVNGDPKPYDADAKSWLAGCLEYLFKRTGYGAERRALRRLSEGGLDALLRDTREIGSDYAQRIYLTVALDEGKLDAAGLGKVLETAGQELDSDYDCAELLVHAEEHPAFGSAVVPAYLAAAGTLQSDYDERRALTTMLEDQDRLGPESVESILQLASNLDSSYDLAELLVESLQHLPADRPPSPGFIRAADAIDSDYDRRRVLSAALERKPLQTSVLLSIVQSAEKMSSNYDRAEVLVQLAETHGIDAELRPAFMSAARSLSSSYDRGRVLSAGAEHGL
jgi:beta-lactamase regulating signal transducer with metallopeptidase domain